MSSEVFSESLAFPQVKQRAVGARSFRVKIPPSNSGTFSPEQTIQIDLPGNLRGQYFNFNQMYLKMSVTSAADYTLDRAGALGFIKRLQISTAGAQICDLNNYNVLATALIDTESSSEWKAGYGSTMLGTLGDALTGMTFTTGTNVFCIPIVLNPMANTSPHRLLPASSLSSISMRITLDSAASSVKSAASAAALALSFHDVEMVCMMTELSPGAQAQIDAATGGKYNILATSWMQSSATREANVGSLTANLGFSVSSLEKIIAIHRPSTTVNNMAAYSLGNRATGGLTEYQYLLNNENYPARPVLVDSRGSEAAAELLISSHALVDWNKGSSYNNGFAMIGVTADQKGQGALSGIAPNLAKAQPFALVAPTGLTAGVSGSANTVASDIGTFFASTEFESALSYGKSSHIYSGISTIASVVQFKGTYGAASAQALSIDFFANFTVLLSLDAKAQNVWSVSV